MAKKQRKSCCRYCSNCKPLKRGQNKRHYCQLKLQAFRQAGGDENRDGIKAILVTMNETCPSFFLDAIWHT